MNQGWDGKLLLFNGNERDEALTGRTVLETRTWHHVAFVRNGKHVTVYLNGNPQPEIDGELEPTFAESDDEIFLGGRSDRMFGLEGRLDEVALYDRELTAEEVVRSLMLLQILMNVPAGSGLAAEYPIRHPVAGRIHEGGPCA